VTRNRNNSAALLAEEVAGDNLLTAAAGHTLAAD
jgi:hypothetical protein